MNAPETEYGYLRVGATEETSNFGDKHTVEYYKPVALTPTGETAPYDNGYEQMNQPTYTTPTGRIYQRQISWDYTARPYFRPLNGDGPTLHSKTSVATHSRDTDGAALTSDTPAGETMADLITAGRFMSYPAYTILAAEVEV